MRDRAYFLGRLLVDFIELAVASRSVDPVYSEKRRSQRLSYGRRLIAVPLIKVLDG